MKPLYFASGSSRPADIRGFAVIGHPIGVAANELSENAVVELEALGGRGIPVFVDSGAFSEVEFGPAGPEVVRPISEGDWREIIDLYLRLAIALGPFVYVVAPDRVGDQNRTLYLLSHFKKELRLLAAMGANVLVPMQKGSRSQADFAAAVRALLRFDFVHAIPSKKNATTLAELDSYMRAVRPARVHLLGLGPKNRNAAKALAIVEAASPGAAVTLDSNMIAANVGRTKRLCKLTAARDHVARLHPSAVRARSAQEVGIVLAFGSTAAKFKDLAVPRAQQLIAALLPGVTVDVLGVE